MFEKLFEDGQAALEIVLFIMAAVLIILSLVILINCCTQCFCRGTNDLQRCEEEDQKFFDKEYYDEICTLLYRHKQMEIRQMEREQELARKQAHKQAESQTDLLGKRPRVNSERLLLLKQELEQYKIDHNIQIKERKGVVQTMANKRRTWIGLQDDGKFKPVQMPYPTVSGGVQTTGTSERHIPAKISDGYETTV